MRRFLTKLGLHYRSNVRSLLGKPDIVFSHAKVVVFCDGDFWHGRDWRKLRRKLRSGSNGTYWAAKIAANRRRDKMTQRELQRAGWKVIRVWETDILRDPARAAERVQQKVASLLP